MKYRVTRRFRDRFTRVKYFPGDVYEATAVRAAELKRFLGERIYEPKPKPDEDA